MIASKIMEQEYVTRVGVSKAFEEYFYSKDDMTMKMLAATQYYNSAVEKTEAGDIKGALEQMCKAYYLNPSDKHKFMKMALLIDYLNLSKYETMKEVVYLSELVNFRTGAEGLRTVAGQFELIVQYRLLDNSDTQMFERAFVYLKTNISDSLAINEISRIYNKAFAHFHASKGQIDETLKYARAALVFNQKDVKVQDIVTFAIVQKMSLRLDGQKSLDAMEDYTKEFPFLRANNYFETLVAVNLAFGSYNYFQKDNGEMGYKYLGQFKEQLKKIDRTAISRDAIAMPFAEAAAFHFRGKDYGKARGIIHDGFKYAPDHPELVERLKIVNEESNKYK